MKNVSPHQIKKCIFVEFEKFKEDVSKAFEEDVLVSSDYEGIYFEKKENTNSEYYDYLNFEEVLYKLEKYYDVKISSIHIDDCDIVGVWICYKDITS